MESVPLFDRDGKPVPLMGSRNGNGNGKPAIHPNPVLAALIDMGYTVGGPGPTPEDEQWAAEAFNRAWGDFELPGPDPDELEADAAILEPETPEDLVRSLTTYLVGLGFFPAVRQDRVWVELGNHRLVVLTIEDEATATPDAETQALPPIAGGGESAERTERFVPSDRDMEDFHRAGRTTALYGYED